MLSIRRATRVLSCRLPVAFRRTLVTSRTLQTRETVLIPARDTTRSRTPFQDSARHMSLGATSHIEPLPVSAVVSLIGANNFTSYKFAQSGLKTVVSDNGLDVRIYYLECLAQATYLITHEGNAMIVDPRRDVDAFIEVSCFTTVTFLNS